MHSTRRQRQTALSQECYFRSVVRGGLCRPVFLPRLHVSRIQALPSPGQTRKVFYSSQTSPYVLMCLSQFSVYLIPPSLSSGPGPLRPRGALLHPVSDRDPSPPLRGGDGSRTPALPPGPRASLPSSTKVSGWLRSVKTKPPPQPCRPSNPAVTCITFRLLGGVGAVNNLFSLSHMLSSSSHLSLSL